MLYSVVLGTCPVPFNVSFCGLKWMPCGHQALYLSLLMFNMAANFHLLINIRTTFTMATIHKICLFSTCRTLLKCLPMQDATFFGLEMEIHEYTHWCESEIGDTSCPWEILKLKVLKRGHFCRAKKAVSCFSGVKHNSVLPLEHKSVIALLQIWLQRFKLIIWYRQHYLRIITIFLSHIW